MAGRWRRLRPFVTAFSPALPAAWRTLYADANKSV
jgi:hypothetical protein